MPDNRTVEIKVKSELYGVTDCVVNVSHYKEGRKTFPCGDGCDHTLTTSDRQKVDQLIKDYGYCSEIVN